MSNRHSNQETKKNLIKKEGTYKFFPLRSLLTLLLRTILTKWSKELNKCINQLRNKEKGWSEKNKTGSKKWEKMWIRSKREWKKRQKNIIVSASPIKACRWHNPKLYPNNPSHKFCQRDPPASKAIATMINMNTLACEIKKTALFLLKNKKNAFQLSTALFQKKKLFDFAIICNDAWSMPPKKLDIPEAAYQISLICIPT